MALAGLRGTAHWPADWEETNFRQFLLRLAPNGRAPFTALTSLMKSEPTPTPTFNIWNYVDQSVRLQVNGAHNNTVTTITVDSSDPTTLTGSYYGDPRGLQIGDLLLVEPTVDTPTGQPEILRVTGVTSATQFTVERGAAGTTAAPIADDTFLLRIGNAQTEGAAAPPAVSRDAIATTNYTQIFYSTFEITGTAHATMLALKTETEVKVQRARMVWDHAEKIEQAFLWGKASSAIGTNGQRIRTTAGLKNQIAPANRTVFSAPVTFQGLVDAIWPAFRFSSKAGSERIAFCGQAALTAINRMVAEDANVNLTFEGLTEFFGLKFRRLVFPFGGEVLINTHPLMSLHPLYSRAMFIVDPTIIRYRYLQGRDTIHKKGIQGDNVDRYGESLLTECGLEVMGGGLSCAYVGNIYRS